MSRKREYTWTECILWGIIAGCAISALDAIVTMLR
jgi:hypothetical protein